jgi:hypothetical protein
MNRALRTYPLMLTVALIAACSNSAPDNAAVAAPAPDAPQAIVAPPVETAPVQAVAPAPAPDGDSLSVYKSLGRRQCEAGGETPESLAAQLRAAGVEAIPAGCADDGMMYAAMCGGGTGHLGVLEIRAADAERAAKAGFRPLKDLPDAQRIPCPASAKDMMK